MLLIIDNTIEGVGSSPREIRSALERIEPGVRIVTERFDTISPEHVKVLSPSHIFLSGQSHPWDRYSREQLAGVFKAFHDQKINFAIIATKQPVASEPPRVDSGVLKLYGYFDTAPSRLSYLLEFIGSEGEWKASRVEVHLKPIK